MNKCVFIRVFAVDVCEYKILVWLQLVLTVLKQIFVLQLNVLVIQSQLEQL